MDTRLSTLGRQQMGMSNMQMRSKEMLTAHTQLSNNRRLVTPADDPVAAALSLGVDNQRVRIEQFTLNSKVASDTLGLLEANLNSVNVSMQALRELAIQAGDGALSDDNRRSIAAVVAGHFNTLFNLSNTSDAYGQFLYSGYQGQLQPFVLYTDPASDVGAVGYQSDEGIRRMPVSESVQLQVSLAGDTVFGVWKAPTPASTTNARTEADNSLFASVKLLHDALVTGRETAYATYDADVQTALNGISAAQTRMALQVGELGARMGELATIIYSNEAQALQYQTQYSQMVDVDYAKTISDFMLSQQLLEFSQKAYKMVQSLSLFNYI